MNLNLLRNACLCLLGVAVGACTPIPQGEKVAEKKEFVFPSPPDEPRFIYERTIRGSADVEAAKEGSALRQALTGVGTTTELLSKPYAVAVHKGRVLVSDSADRHVRVFDVPAQKYYKIGDDEAGAIAKPLGIDVDNAGNVYVADALNKAILVYDIKGKFLRKIGDAKQFDRLSSVTVDADGKRLYVVDIGGVSSQLHRVRVYDATNGTHLFDIGKRGSGPGEFNLPRDVAIGKDGRLYVVDGGNFRVQVFDASGKYLQAFGTVGKQLGNFARPKEIATDAEGNVYVVDAAFGNFQIFNADGDLLMFVGSRSERDGPANYMLPSGITVDEDGRVYMVDQWFRKVDVYRPATLAVDGGFLGQRPKAEVKGK
ncbi:MAG TPA: 6-bladed beta-propeller [Azospira sp.]|nr:6-bladed beta-propeller [Azospira sp.]